MHDAGSEGRGVGPDLFKEAMARWASTVTVVAVRGAEDGKVRATTVTSFAPISAEPPEVVVSLNPSAQVLPFLEEGDSLGISLLAEGQTRWARVFADSFPVGPTPWSEDGPPLIADAVVGLACSVRALHTTEGRSRLVVARVDGVSVRSGAAPLLYWERTYRKVSDEEV